jgi:uncharacterized protein Veg
VEIKRLPKSAFYYIQNGKEFKDKRKNVWKVLIIDTFPSVIIVTEEEKQQRRGCESTGWIEVA